MKKKQEKIELGELYYDTHFSTTVIPLMWNAWFESFGCLNIDGRKFNHSCGAFFNIQCGILSDPNDLIKLKSPAHLKKLEGK